MSMSVFYCALLALALQSANADNSKTPSVSNIPSTTNTQSPTSTPVASATQGNTLINDGHWEQLAPFKDCANGVAWDATYEYNIDQTFEITQHLLYYASDTICEKDNGVPYLDIALHGEGGPFGLVRANELYTLQRFEFDDAVFQIPDNAWRSVKLLNDATIGCPCLLPGTGLNYSFSIAELTGDCDEAECPLFYSWALPHYNAYDVTSTNIMSVSKMTEDVGENFFTAEIGTVIKSPDTPSVSPTPSMSPSTVASGTPSNSPLGPYMTTWLQVSPRMKCDDVKDPHREEFNFFFDGHDGYGTSDVRAYGNITGYPSRSACYSDWRRIYTVKALAKGSCFIDSANKEGYRNDEAYTLCMVRMNWLSFRPHRWRATKRWNDMVSGCRMEEDALDTGDTHYWQPFNIDGDLSSLIADGTCEMFYKWNQKLYFTVHQRDHFGVNNHEGHRNAQISDFSLDWIDTNPLKTSIAYEPMDRSKTNSGDFLNRYYGSFGDL